MFALGTTRLNKITAGTMVFEEIPPRHVCIDIYRVRIRGPHFRNLIFLFWKQKLVLVFLDDSMELKNRGGSLWIQIRTIKGFSVWRLVALFSCFLRVGIQQFSHRQQITLSGLPSPALTEGHQTHLPKTATYLVPNCSLLPWEVAFRAKSP